MTSAPRPQPIVLFPKEVDRMELEIYPVRIKEGTKLLPRRRGAVRVLWIVPDPPKGPLSAGYTFRSAPAI